MMRRATATGPARRGRLGGPNATTRRAFSDTASALAETGRAGILTTCDNQVIDRSRYWMDINGGSDMGGITYFFHTSNLPTRTTVLGTCFPDEFRVKYMSTTGNLEEFRLRPVVYSETLLLPIYLPLVVR